MEGNVYVYVDNCSREKYKLALRDVYIYIGRWLWSLTGFPWLCSREHKKSRLRDEFVVTRGRFPSSTYTRDDDVANVKEKVV